MAFINVIVTFTDAEGTSICKWPSTLFYISHDIQVLSLGIFLTIVVVCVLLLISGLFLIGW